MGRKLGKERAEWRWGGCGRGWIQQRWHTPYPIPFPAVSLSPFSAQTCASQIASTGLRRPIAESDAYRAIKRFKSFHFLSFLTHSFLLDTAYPFFCMTALVERGEDMIGSW